MIDFIAPIRLRKGNGSGSPKDGLCLMQAVVEVTKGPVADAFDIAWLPDHAAALRAVKTVAEVHNVALKAKADAYAAFADAAAAKLKMWRKAKDIFARAILLGRHGELDPVVVIPRAEHLRRTQEHAV